MCVLKLFSLSAHYLFAHLPFWIWEAIAKEMSTNLLRNKNNQSSTRLYALKEVSAAEALRFYGVLLLIENSYGNDTRRMRDHFIAVKRSIGGSFSMGYNR